ncbi:MAG: hypothetical protein OEW58_08185 [Gammaproteobacteria bacterium]|nr:hypothetical protein [Gammaproteobacteria bacterium]
MITKSIIGTLNVSHAYSQLPVYNRQANHYMTDLRANLLTHEHGEALASAMVDQAEAGRAFVAKAVEVATWYVPPRGRVVDVYA